MSQINEFFRRQDFTLFGERIKRWTLLDRSEQLRKIGLFVVSLLVTAVFFFPFYWLLKIALTSANLYSGAPSLLLEDPNLFNFVEVWYRADYATYLMNSITLTVIAIVGNLVFNSLFAYSLTLDFHGRSFVEVVLVVGMLVPFQTSIIPAFLVTQELGLLNTHLGVALPYAAAIINILILTTSFRSVPDSLIESARMDGASELYIIFGVYWPLSKSALATNVILSFVWMWNAYLWPLVVISDPSLRPLPLGLAEFQSTLSGSYALQYAFAIMVILPIVILFLLMQKQFIRSVATSALKE
jgi:ABC-type glycerol-3-phosphate transport system permease component